jgi:hypothetical protein
MGSFAINLLLDAAYSGVLDRTVSTINYTLVSSAPSQDPAESPKAFPMTTTHR